MDVDGTSERAADSRNRGFEPAKNVNHLLRRAHARADQLFDETMQDLGVTPRQAALLYGIRRRQGSSISALTALTGMDRGTLSEMVPRLTKRGWVERRLAMDDGRAMALYLTDDGASLLEKVDERTRQLQEKVLEPLPHEYHELFIKILSLFVGISVETQAKTQWADDAGL